MRSVVLILLDGVADRAYDELGGLTPLEAAPTPHLDRLALEGASASVYPLGPGLVPSSELAHFHLFGYAGDPFPGRAVLEALGRGLLLPSGSVITHAGLRHVTPCAEGFRIAEWWPGADEDAEGDAAIVLREVERFEAEGVTITLRRLDRTDSILILDGGSEWVTDSDPFFFAGLPVARVEQLESAPDPAAAARTARALNAYLLHSFRALDRHPVNRARAGRSMNMLVTKWTGRNAPLPPFERRAGLSGAIVASTPVYAGFAAALAMRWVEVPERPDDPETEMAEKLMAARDALERGVEFVHVHTKAADEAAHTGSPTAKRDVIAALDRGLEALWRDRLVERFVVAVTADHATPSRGPMLHCGDSVPLAASAPTVRRDRVAAFGERDAASGSLGQLRARDVLPLLLNAADRARFLGGRLNPDAGLGAPRISPLRLEEN